MDQQTAKQWILTNWNVLSKEKRAQALQNYFKKFAKREKTIVDHAKEVFIS